MQTKSTHTPAIRFRRFTRKAYAAFCSVQRIVTIGQLSVDIANCELRKSSVWFSLNHSFCALESQEEFQETPQEMLPLELALLVPMTVANSGNGAAACNSDYLNLIYTRSCCFTNVKQQLLFL